MKILELLKINKPSDYNALYQCDYSIYYWFRQNAGDIPREPLSRYEQDVSSVLYIISRKK